MSRQLLKNCVSFHACLLLRYSLTCTDPVSPWAFAHESVSSAIGHAAILSEPSKRWRSNLSTR